MLTVDGLQIEKNEDGNYTVSNSERSFEVNGTTLVPSKDWFCTYETIKTVLQVIEADTKLGVDDGSDI